MHFTVTTTSPPPSNPPPLLPQEPAVQTLSLEPPKPSLSVGMTVIAEHEYIPLSAQDLELKKDEEYTILEMPDANWWRARDKYG